MSKIVRVEKRHPETALENLNRLTGLDFQSWPESLLETGEDVVVDNLDTASRPEGGSLACRRVADNGR
ncbi:hypothetical protein ACLD02_18660 [Alloalcanivorax sp. C16-2]|uniref:hypothetical protein n=1 Tax=Alloalcanivorax TaxID=3020832 RepID=UPI001931F915|nr:hypothetical protein [Alloalcanivorax marinus]MBL7252296.1 hypothetical protein [Alloalcanivorax marinus]